jgi:FkbM family methyltransferase
MPVRSCHSATHNETMISNQTTEIQLPGGAKYLFRHRGSYADLGVIEQILTNRDYALEALTRGEEMTAHYRALISAAKTPLIIDCGANIGASARWFGHAFPGAHIVCIEPDAGNFDLLQANAKGINADLRLAAISAEDGVVALVDPGEGEWGYRTQHQVGGTVPALSLKRIIGEKMAAGYVPFIVKIDIEGAEGELFSAHTDWIADVPLIIIELHDWLLPKQRTSQNFIRAIAGHDRDFVHVGENIFSLRND